MSKQKKDQPKGKQKATPAKKGATKVMPVVPTVEVPTAKPKREPKK